MSLALIGKIERLKKLGEKNRALSRDRKPKQKSVKFTPNKGGQEELFNMIPLDKEYTGDIKYYYLRGGNGAGKSLCGAMFAASRSRLDPEARGLISAGTYGQLATSTLVALADACRTFGIDLKIGSSKIEPFGETELTARKIAHDRFCFINGAYVYVLAATIFKGGTDKATQVGRGLQVRWLWFDEPAYAPKDAFQTMQTRIGRGTGSMPPISLLTGTINKDNPRNWCYEFFDDPDRSKHLASLYKSIICPTSQNLSNLASGYESVLRAGFTDELAAIELDANYAQSSSNLVFSYFDRDIHCDRDLEISARYPIHVSIDFNHHPACAIAAQFVPHSQEIIILKEWYLEYSDTFKLSAAIADWYQSINLIDRSGWGSETGLIHVHGDASGNQKTANSKKTNWQIVKTALTRKEIRFQTHYGKANPGIKDTVNSVNCAFKSEKLWLNPVCKELVKDLEYLQWSNTGDIDKKNISRSHLADCMRYIVWDLLPYNRLVQNTTQRSKLLRPVGVV